MSALLSFKVNTLEHHCNFVWRSSVAGPHYRCQIISRQIVLARKYLSPMDSQTGPSYRELTTAQQMARQCFSVQITLDRLFL